MYFGKTQRKVLSTILEEGGATNIWTLCRKNGDVRAGFIPQAVNRLVDRGVLIDVRDPEQTSLTPRERLAYQHAKQEHPRAYRILVLAERYIAEIY
jgi:ribosomal protein L19E